MKTLVNGIKKFWRDEVGASAVEYALVVAFVAVALVGASTVLNGSFTTLFTGLGTCIANPSVANCT